MNRISRVELEHAIEAIRNAQEFSPAPNPGEFESSMCGGGPCTGAPCNPGPRMKDGKRAEKGIT